MNQASFCDTYLFEAKETAWSRLQDALAQLHPRHRITITSTERLFAQYVVVGFRIAADIHPRSRGPVMKASYIVMLAGHIVQEKPTRTVIQESCLQSETEARLWLAYTLLVERCATEEEVLSLVVTSRIQEDTRIGWEIASPTIPRLAFFVSEKGRYTRISS